MNRMRVTTGQATMGNLLLFGRFATLRKRRVFLLNSFSLLLGVTV